MQWTCGLPCPHTHTSCLVDMAADVKEATSKRANDCVDSLPPRHPCGLRLPRRWGGKLVVFIAFRALYHGPISDIKFSWGGVGHGRRDSRDTTRGGRETRSEGFERHGWRGVRDMGGGVRETRSEGLERHGQRGLRDMAGGVRETRAEGFKRHRRSGSRYTGGGV